MTFEQVPLVPTLQHAYDRGYAAGLKREADLLAAIDELTATNREKEMRLNQLELADRRDAKQARVNELEATVHVVEDNAFEYEMRAAYAEEQVAAQRDRIDKMAAQIVVEKTAAGLWATEAGKRGRVINELTAELKALQSWAVPQARLDELEADRDYWRRVAAES